MKSALISHRIQNLLMRRFEARVMENVYRGDYVECMVAHALGHDWQLTWINGWNWAVWDIEHRTGVRVEVKQSSARQSWDRAAEAPDRQAIARFDIAPRTGYWLKNGGDWIPFQSPSRPADVYVFAWHGERRREFADQSDPAQWRFFVVAESELPCLQKTIGLQVLKRSYSSCRIGELPDAIATAFPNQLEIGAKPPD